MLRNYIKRCVLYIITRLAAMIINKHQPYIIAITGNLGKTSTKNNISAVLSDYSIIYSEKSYNSEFGIPLTILRSNSGWSSVTGWLKVILNGVRIYLSKEYVDYLILEVGADKKGDIESVSKWLRPNIVVMTQFADVPVHVENFKNREELIREKRYLMEALQKDGLFIYNADCKDSAKMVEMCKVSTVSFGLKYGNYIAGTISNNIYEGKVEANVSTPRHKSLKLELYGIIGEAAILCALPAIIIGDIFEIELDEVLSRLSSYKREAGRMRLLTGVGQSYIIDDTYNSSPLAVESGLRTLRSLSGKHRKIMILGDMLELGEHTSSEHKRIGRIAAESGDILVTVGSRSKLTAASAIEKGMKEGYVLECKNSTDAGHAVREILKEGDVIYIKGSQGMRMEKATKLVISDEVNIKRDLPRQDKEWLNID